MGSWGEARREEVKGNFVLLEVFGDLFTNLHNQHFTLSCKYLPNSTKRSGQLLTNS
jgi:hypothetical protein